MRVDKLASVDKSACAKWQGGGYSDGHMGLETRNLSADRDTEIREWKEFKQQWRSRFSDGITRAADSALVARQTELRTMGKEQEADTVNIRQLPDAEHIAEILFDYVNGRNKNKSDADLSLSTNNLPRTMTDDTIGEAIRHAIFTHNPELLPENRRMKWDKETEK